MVGVGCIVEMGLVAPVLVGICGRWGGWSGNDLVGEECDLGIAITSYGPRFFLESFFDGRVVWKYLALT